jgi:hypothetical protein
MHAKLFICGLFYSWLLAAIGLPINAQSTGFGNKATIYLVRHAEKLTGKDPLLTEQGNKRAGDLMRALKGKKHPAPIRNRVQAYAKYRRQFKDSIGD